MAYERWVTCRAQTGDAAFDPVSMEVYWSRGGDPVVDVTERGAGAVRTSFVEIASAECASLVVVVLEAGLSLLADVEARFRTAAGGGRPTDPRWTERRLVPLAPRTLERLEEITARVREHGRFTWAIPA